MFWTNKRVCSDRILQKGWEQVRSESCKNKVKGLAFENYNIINSLAPDDVSRTLNDVLFRREFTTFAIFITCSLTKTVHCVVT